MSLWEVTKASAIIFENLGQSSQTLENAIFLKRETSNTQGTTGLSVILTGKNMEEILLKIVLRHMGNKKVTVDSQSPC